MRFKLVEAYLNETRNDTKSLVNEISNNLYRVKGFFNQFPDWKAAIEKFDKLDLDEFEVHHISGQHSTQRAHYSNNPTLLVLVHKSAAPNLHRTITKEYIDVVNSMGDGGFLNGSSDPSTQKVIDILNTIKQEHVIKDTLDAFKLLIERLETANISCNDVFKIDVKCLRLMNKKIPLELTKFFNSNYLHNSNIIPFTQLKAYKKGFLR